MTFLGHIVSNQGIECDPDKVAAIASWPQPTNMSEVRLSCTTSHVMAGLAITICHFDTALAGKGSQ